MRGLTEAEFVTEVRTFRTSAFRLEAQPGYVLDYERPVFEGWLAGMAVPPPEVDWWAPWLHRVARWTADEGKTIGRVRVLAEPPTTYQRWLMWATPWHAEVGEKLRYMPRSTAEQIGLPLGDFWLLDDERVIVMRFNGQGETVSRTLVTDPEVAAGYCALRDAAIDHSATAETIVPA